MKLEGLPSKNLGSSNQFGPTEINDRKPLKPMIRTPSRPTLRGPFPKLGAPETKLERPAKTMLWSPSILLLKGPVRPSSGGPEANVLALQCIWSAQGVRGPHPRTPFDTPLTHTENNSSGVDSWYFQTYYRCNADLGHGIASKRSTVEISV